MAVVLVTGMSGTGKSAVLAGFARRGHAVADTDYGDHLENVAVPGQDEPEPMWREDRITALLDTSGERQLFIGGTVANQESFYPRFDAVGLLSAPDGRRPGADRLPHDQRLSATARSSARR